MLAEKTSLTIEGFTPDQVNALVRLAKLPAFKNIMSSVRDNVVRIFKPFSHTPYFEISYAKTTKKVLKKCFLVTGTQEGSFFPIHTCPSL